MTNRKKICYILPRYEEGDYTHFAHLPDLIREVAKSADVYLLVEKAETTIKPEDLVRELGVKKAVVLKPGSRCLKNFLAIGRMRIAGVKNFYVHYSFLAAFNAALISKLTGGRVFYWNCGLPWQYRRPWQREKFEKLVYHLISFLVTGTSGLAKAYAQHYKLSLTKIKVMPNWISPERFVLPAAGEIVAFKKELDILPQDKVLLFVHRLSKRKGAHLLPQIFRQVSFSSKKMIIVGDGPERENLEKELAGEIAGGEVKFLGWQPNQEIIKFYALADVFILPSEEEGFPRVLLETMVVGLPFVAFNVGGIKEIVSLLCHDFLAPAGDVERFVFLVDNLLADSIGNQDLRRDETQEWIKRFNTEKVAQIFLGLF
ncbi:MAG: glycosyltransferase family 4 protein [Candidatus Portnoybacteria bacterium]|jgi:glycosyltransferase involved in cell wall biosynthesis|nr:glycosyltransferase family 4 protein [Candidatus Portnoybacteria bacterium]